MTGLRVVSDGKFWFDGRDGRVPHADVVVVKRVVNSRLPSWFQYALCVDFLWSN